MTRFVCGMLLVVILARIVVSCGGGDPNPPRGNLHPVPPLEMMT